jgi:hypothetical protein
LTDDPQGASDQIATGLEPIVTDTASLKDQIASFKGKTTASQLRALMPDIDRRVREGVDHETIVAGLTEAGLPININTFRSNLYRYRAKAKNSKVGSMAETPPPRSEPNTARNTVIATEPMEDGNPPAELPETEPDTVTAETPKLGDILDANKSEAFTDQFMNRRRPIIGQKNRSEKQ